MGFGRAKTAGPPAVIFEGLWLWTRYVCDCFSMAWPILMTLSAMTPSPTQRFIPASPL
jgi:hypothetical protein